MKQKPKHWLRAAAAKQVGQMLLWQSTWAIQHYEECEKLVKRFKLRLVVYNNHSYDIIDPETGVVYFMQLKPVELFA